MPEGLFVEDELQLVIDFFIRIAELAWPALILTVVAVVFRKQFFGRLCLSVSVALAGFLYAHHERELPGWTFESWLYEDWWLLLALVAGLVPALVHVRFRDHLSQGRMVVAFSAATVTTCAVAKLLIENEGWGPGSIALLGGGVAVIVCLSLILMAPSDKTPAWVGPAVLWIVGASAAKAFVLQNSVFYSESIGVLAFPCALVAVGQFVFRDKQLPELLAGAWLTMFAFWLAGAWYLVEVPLEACLLLALSIPVSLAVARFIPLKPLLRGLAGFAVAGVMSGAAVVLSIPEASAW